MLPPGFEWETVLTGTHRTPERLWSQGHVGFRRMVGPKTPITQPGLTSDESIAELRRRLSGD